MVRKQKLTAHHELIINFHKALLWALLYDIRCEYVFFTCVTYQQLFPYDSTYWTHIAVLPMLPQPGFLSAAYIPISFTDSPGHSNRNDKLRQDTWE